MRARVRNRAKVRVRVRVRLWVDNRLRARHHYTSNIKA